MGKMMFGHQETVTCIQDIQQRGPDGQELCLAYKTSGYFFVAGVYLQDDGYVLRPRNDSKSFFALPPELTRAMQHEGALPTPLPSYQVPVWQYAFGYSLWIILAGLAIWAAVSGVLKRRRRESDDAIPVTYGPPVIKTEADRFVESQIAPMLRPGERVQHQAYTASEVLDNGSPAPGAPAHYVVLTDQRLIFIQCRQGAFGPLLENKGVEEIDRRVVTAVVREDRTVVVQTGHSGRMMWIYPTKKLSNQDAFRRDVPRLLADAIGAATAPAAASAA